MPDSCDNHSLIGSIFLLSHLMLKLMFSIALLKASAATPRFGFFLINSRTLSRSNFEFNREVAASTKLGNVNDKLPNLKKKHR